MPRVDDYAYAPYGAIPAGIENATLSDSEEYVGVKGYVCDADGTLAVEMDDGSTGTVPVLKGLQYSGAVKKFLTTGSVDVTAVTIYY